MSSLTDVTGSAPTQHGEGSPTATGRSGAEPTRLGTRLCVPGPNLVNSGLAALRVGSSVVVFGVAGVALGPEELEVLGEVDVDLVAVVEGDLDLVVALLVTDLGVDHATFAEVLQDDGGSLVEGGAADRNLVLRRMVRSFLSEGCCYTTSLPGPAEGNLNVPERDFSRAERGAER